MAVDLSELKAELTELGGVFPNLPDTELFVLWFVRAFLVDSPEVARQALTGGSNDKGVDAVFIDEQARRVFVIQGKYRQGGGPEGRTDVMQLAGLAKPLTGDAAAFSDLRDGLDEL